MIEHQYKAKVCDICRKTLAVKKKFFYETKNSYMTMRGKTTYGTGRQKVHLCDLCLLRMRDEIRKALEERPKT